MFVDVVFGVWLFLGLFVFYKVGCLGVWVDVSGNCLIGRFRVHLMF